MVVRDMHMQLKTGTLLMPSPQRPACRGMPLNCGCGWGLILEVCRGGWCCLVVAALPAELVPATTIWPRAVITELDLPVFCRRALPRDSRIVIMMQVQVVM